MGCLFLFHLRTEQVLVNESEMKIIDIGPDLLELYSDVTAVHFGATIYFTVFLPYYLLTKRLFTNSMAWLIG